MTDIDGLEANSSKQFAKPIIIYPKGLNERT